MNSLSPWIDPLQELSQALKQATPSVDERLLVPESITERANQIEKELAEDIWEDETDSIQAINRLDTFFNKNTPNMDRGKEVLFQLNNASRRAASQERDLAEEFTKTAQQFSSNLQALNQILDAFKDTQERRFREEQERDDLIRELQKQFASYDDVFQHAMQGRSQRPRRPRAEDVAREARILAETQARRELLHQQRHHQLNQGRIVFFLTVALLSLGVLLVFVGVVGVYIFHLAAGTITAVSGTLVNLIGVIVLVFNKRENDRLDAITRELSTLDRMTMAMQYISQISDREKRDQALADLARRLTETHS